MSQAKLNTLLYGALCAAALLAASVSSRAEEAGASATGGPVVCKDGTTAAHGGRGACHGH
ncbi:MAG: hypothetical protein JO173_04125, partial [Gammaproteobacteria bacterium]|nr:hypothetical protein [Gammaproteobacteria bacterium]